MVGNIGIGIANAIGFRRKNLGGGHISYPGLIAAWSAKGKTNDDADRAVLRDLTGNGHDITLKNFAYSGMSGYGGYETKAANWYSDIGIEFKREGFKWEFSSTKYLNIALMYCDFDYNGTCKIRIQNIPQNITVKCGDNRTETSIKDITEDGIYEIDWSLLKSNVLPVIYTDKVFNNSNLIIEILPEYPDALVFDGVDDYGVNENLSPLLDKEYTVIFDRMLLEPVQSESSSFVFTEKNIFSPFGLDYVSNGRWMTWNFDASTNIDNFIIKTKNITWQTDLLYNGNNITKGSAPLCKVLYLGGWKSSYSGRIISSHLAFYSAYLFNRTLTDQEIKSFIRKYIDPEYLLPSETAPTPPPNKVN